tara:strand:- start:13 stop:603 length:591 start_codon:yes stop_codon:yes gene_type:complete
MSKKLKFKLNDNVFTLPLEAYRESNWGGTLEKYIHMSAKNTATVIKQYVKKEFPQYKVWGVSDTYSGGSSTRVYVCNPDGSSIPENDYKKIQQWKWILSGGSFNGMEDIYEYREDELTTDAGMSLKYFPSYIFIDNKPKWGTPEYWLGEYNTYKENLTNPDYARMRELVNKAGSFLEYNKTYMTKGEYNRCVPHFS